EDIVKAPRSYTGKFLAPVLKKADGKPRKSSGASEAAERESVAVRAKSRRERDTNGLLGWLGLA
ncbi:MAG: hypothetical protein J0L64_23935, partial [Acidobacteria bacterium]|nr:hypothetical protein [Acidobacteriota bacterium]